MSKTFIIGISGSGKTTLARKMAEKWNVPYISASECLADVPLPPGCSRQERAEYLSDYTTNILRKNPGFCSNYLQQKHGKDTLMYGNEPVANPESRCSAVIEGIRNPYDFMQLFRPENGDEVVSIEYNNNPCQKTYFEQGLEVIDSYLYWLVQNNVMDPWQYQRISFDRFTDQEKQSPLERSLQEFNLC